MNLFVPEAAVEKANRMLAIMKTSFAVLNICTLPLLFKTFVRPLVKYGNIICGPHSKLNQQALQKYKMRATKVIPQL